VATLVRCWLSAALTSKVTTFGWYIVSYSGPLDERSHQSHRFTTRIPTRS
jgi:hypothetical protein